MLLVGFYNNFNILLLASCCNNFNILSLFKDGKRALELKC